MATAEKVQAEITQVHGGKLVARRLKAHGVDKLFTLSGGHLFSIYDGCRDEGIDLIDTRHEQTAAFAAEGWSKATRTLGVCALTAGPGVTNGMSTLGSAHENNSPLLVLGGRAPHFRWGQGSLQEIDHIPFVKPLTKFAETATDPAAIPGLVDDAIKAALAAPTGPAFVDFPLDVVFSEGHDGSQPASTPSLRDAAAADGVEIERVAALLARAKRPAIIAGTNLYWGFGEEALRELARELGVPVFLSGLARGCLPADDPCFFSRARSAALQGADVALAIGVPMDFRLAFGGAFGDRAKVVRIDFAPSEPKGQRQFDGELYGGLDATLKALTRAALDAGANYGLTKEWLQELRTVEEEKRAAELGDLNDDRSPLHPLRIYKELNQLLDHDATVIGDGGDFVSYAGKSVDVYRPGHWMDPGPFGCLGSGPGYAIAAQLARPKSQTVLLQGDGAFGFSGMEFDTMVRHKLPVVAVIGNNGIWGLEKHPMEFVYGYSVVADLRPATRYDEVVAALGGHGELVEEPKDLKPALERAFASGLPACVNVLTDPEVVYPRKANLA